MNVSVKNGHVLVYCHAGCSQDDFINVLREQELWHAVDVKPSSAPQGTRRTRWEIRADGGKTVAVHVRLDYSDGTKDYVWEHT